MDLKFQEEHISEIQGGTYKSGPSRTSGSQHQPRQHLARPVWSPCGWGASSTRSTGGREEPRPDRTALGAGMPPVALPPSNPAKFPLLVQSRPPEPGPSGHSAEPSPGRHLRVRAAGELHWIGAPCPGPRDGVVTPPPELALERPRDPTVHEEDTS